jgi:hypothetical protein
MRPPRGPIPPGASLWLLVAVVAVPEVLKQCKPLTKSLANLFTSVGEHLHKVAETEPSIKISVEVSEPKVATTEVTESPEPTKPQSEEIPVDESAHSTNSDLLSENVASEAGKTEAGSHEHIPVVEVNPESHSFD